MEDEVGESILPGFQVSYIFHKLLDSLRSWFPYAQLREIRKTIFPGMNMLMILNKLIHGSVKVGNVHKENENKTKKSTRIEGNWNLLHHYLHSVQKMAGSPQTTNSK